MMEAETVSDEITEFRARLTKIDGTRTRLPDGPAQTGVEPTSTLPLH